LAPFWIQGVELLWLDLHGGPGWEYWCGDDYEVALRAGNVRRLDLVGTTVFAVNCYLADEGSPMLDALLTAGARYVIGGEGKNWGPARGPLFGAPLLGQWLRRWMAVGFSPLRALAMAKVALYFGRVEVEDTLGFRAYVRNTK
jgi:hypothetical protein